MKPTVYGMLGCKSSNEYTKLAIESFFKNTQLNKDDKFYLIDNDGIDVDVGKYEVIHNDTPKSFAENSNNIINLANDRNVVILSNDVVFTKNWADTIHYYDNIIIVPSCNQTHAYSNEKLQLKATMHLNDYSNLKDELDDVAMYHTKSSTQSFLDSRLISYYVFRLSNKVYSKLGLLDERFGIAGGEDVDYRIRGIIEGIPTKFFNRSFLLHFGGKTTWDGQETNEEITKRNEIYKHKFTEKWGEDLANLCLSNGKFFDVIEKYNLHTEFNQGNFTDIIKKVALLSKINYT